MQRNIKKVQHQVVPKMNHKKWKKNNLVLKIHLIIMKMHYALTLHLLDHLDKEKERKRVKILRKKNQKIIKKNQTFS